MKFLEQLIQIRIALDEQENFHEKYELEYAQFLRLILSMFYKEHILSSALSCSRVCIPFVQVLKMRRADNRK